MSSEKITRKQLREFIKLILDMENIYVYINDENQTLLLCSLLKTHDPFKETLIYGREIFSLP